MPLDPGLNTELQSTSAQQETKQMLITRVLSRPGMGRAGPWSEDCRDIQAGALTLEFPHKKNLQALSLEPQAWPSQIVSPTPCLGPVYKLECQYGVLGSSPHQGTEAALGRVLCCKVPWIRSGTAKVGSR